jgi:hypothetical protein
MINAIKLSGAAQPHHKLSLNAIQDCIPKKLMKSLNKILNNTLAKNAEKFKNI